MVSCQSQLLTLTDSPGQVPLRMHGHVDEQRAEDQQVRPVVDGVLDESRLDLAGDGEASGASVGLHEGQQQPGRESQSFRNTSAGRSDCIHYVF